MYQFNNSLAEHAPVGLGLEGRSDNYVSPDCWVIFEVKRVSNILII